jgi:transposase
MANGFWLSDTQWTAIEPFMPQNQPGPERKGDRRIISGILHVLTSGCRWRDCPKAGWSGEAAAIDATYVKAHRSAQGGKGVARAQAIGPSRGADH